VYLSPLTGDVQQAEVVLGAGSVKHGSGALHGYINFVPKNGVDHAGSRLALDYGLNDDSLRVQVERGYSYGQDRSLYWYAGFYQVGGFTLGNDFGGASSPSISEQRKFLNRDDTSIGNYNPTYKASVNWSHGRLNLKALFEHIEFNPNSLVAGFDNLNQRTTLTVQPKYTLQLPFKSSLELSSSLGLFDRSRILVTMQTHYFDHHELSVGVQVKRLDSRSQAHYFSANPTQHRQYVDGDWREYSVFVEDSFQLSRHTTLLGGWRFDVADFDSELEFDGNNSAISRFRPPDVSNHSVRLALLHKGDNNREYRAVYQEGFAYPTVSEYPLIFAANAFLQSQGVALLQNRPPETLKSFEFGVKGELIEDRLRFDLTAYYNRYENRGRFVTFAGSELILPSELLPSVPAGVSGVVLGLENDVDGYGAEAVLNWQPSDQWSLDFSYAYAVPDHIDDLENQLADLTNDSGSQWSRFPKHQWRANGLFSNGKWRAGIAALYQTGLAIDGNDFFNSRNASEDYARVNLSLGYMVNPRTIFSLSIHNAFENRTPNITVDTSRPWEGALGSDERLIYAALKIR